MKELGLRSKFEKGGGTKPRSKTRDEGNSWRLREWHHPLIDYRFVFIKEHTFIKVYEVDGDIIFFKKICNT